MPTYAVVSFDDDQQQHFIDVVDAPTNDAASALVLDNRPEVSGANALSAGELRELADSLSTFS